MFGCGMDGFDTSRSPIISGLGDLGQVDTVNYGIDDTATAEAQAMIAADVASGVDVSAPWYQGLIQTGSQALQAYLQFRSTDQLMQLNIERAKHGLPPIDVSAYGPQVGVGIAPQTQQFLTYALVGAGALIALLALKRK
jgi:hypothetical protein